MRTGLMVTALIAAGMVLYSELYQYKRIPVPARFLKLAVIWAVLGWMADFGAPQIAIAFAVGLIGTMLFTYLRDGNFAFTKLANAETQTTGQTAERNAKSA